MTVPSEPEVPTTSHADETTQHIRGSSAMLVGRVVSLLLNLVTQVLVVRYLTQSDFGLFAYGMALASFLQIVVSLGQEKQLTRFLAIYDERGDHQKLFGTITLYCATVVVLSAVCLGIMSVVAPSLAPSLDNESTTAVLMIMTLVAPADALDKLGEALFAVFSRARAIFFRKYVLQPIVKLSIIVLVVTIDGSVELLAFGTVLGGVLGILLYLVQLPKLLRSRGLRRRDGVSMPIREVLGHSVPLITTEFVYLSMTTGSVVILGHYRDAVAVAAYRAVFPLARLNQFVFGSFSLLFMPLASRLWARGDTVGLRAAYWRTTSWLAVLSFPVAATTVSLAGPVTELVFGEAYADSATYLALLSLGFYVNVIVGYNQQLLQVAGQVRWLLASNVAVTLLNLVLSFALIPGSGALGVAIANAVALLAQNVINQIGLARRTDIGAFETRYWRVYGVIVCGFVGVAVVELVLRPPVAIAFAIVALTSLLVVRLTRESLAIAETFPELAKLPVVRSLV